ITRTSKRRFISPPSVEVPRGPLPPCWQGKRRPPGCRRRRNLKRGLEMRPLRREGAGSVSAPPAAGHRFPLLASAQPGGQQVSRHGRTYFRLEAAPTPALPVTTERAALACDCLTVEPALLERIYVLPSSRWRRAASSPSPAPRI